MISCSLAQGSTSEWQCTNTVEQNLFSILCIWSSSSYRDKSFNVEHEFERPKRHCRCCPRPSRSDAFLLENCPHCLFLIRTWAKLVAKSVTHKSSVPVPNRLLLSDSLQWENENPGYSLAQVASVEPFQRCVARARGSSQGLKKLVQ